VRRPVANEEAENREAPVPPVEEAPEDDKTDDAVNQEQRQRDINQQLLENELQRRLIEQRALENAEQKQRIEEERQAESAGQDNSSE
jgi:hypothetical protein